MWNCELKTRLSSIVSHLHVGNNYRQILTQHNCKKGFLQCHFKMFSKPLSPFEEFKTNKSVFIVSRTFFRVLNWTTNSRRGIKNLFRSRQREKKKILWTRPRKWPAKVQPNKTEKRQQRKCRGWLSHKLYRRRNKYLQRRHGPWVKTRKRVRRLQSSWIVILRKVQNRAELEQHF